MNNLKIAVLDMYTGVPNEGMRCILNTIENFGRRKNIKTIYEVFDTRGKSLLPKLEDFDGFISSGGPGSPILEGTLWENIFFKFIEELENHNETSEFKKPFFAICHSFQLLVQHYGLAAITKRRSTAFGVMPIYFEQNIDSYPIFKNLDNPFWAVDSRDFQVVNPNYKKILEIGAEILCLEKIRPQVSLERAIMAIKFNEYIYGTQFHPEADGEGMHRLFKQEDKKNTVIKNFGEEKYYQMLDYLDDPEKIEKTESILLPNFLDFCFEKKYLIQAISVC